MVYLQHHAPLHEQRSAFEYMHATGIMLTAFNALLQKQRCLPTKSSFLSADAFTYRWCCNKYSLGWVWLHAKGGENKLLTNIVYIAQYATKNKGNVEK